MRVVSLWRHPVKSMQGHQVDRLTVTGSGVAGDRMWGVRDVASGAVLSAKREPRLLLARTASVGEGVAIELPVGTATGREADALLSAWLGRPVTIEPAVEAPYVDEAHVHVLAAAELGEWDLRRFRPNVVVDGADSLDGFVGERLRLGPVVIEVYARTKRCAMPTMAQPGLPRDVDVLRELARGRDLRLGIYGRVVAPGPLALDDEVGVA